MTQFWRFALLGLGLGGIYALAAQGMVVVFRASGVVNFANGALGMWGAYAYVAARDAGFGTIPSVLLGVGLSALLGAGTHLLVMRHLSRSSALTRFVATLGLLSLLQGLGIGKYGSTIRFVDPLLPDGPIDLSGLFGSGVLISEDRLLLVVIGAGVAGVLYAVYKFTSFGVKTRAVSEREQAFAALGHSPNVVATWNWALGSALAGLAAILVVPITGLAVTQLTFLVLPALAAALVGGFTSFPLTWLGGLFIGFVESELTGGPVPDFFKAPGWSKAVPFVVIITVLVARGRGLPLRGFIEDLKPQVGSGRLRWLLVPIVGLMAVSLTGIEALGLGAINAEWTNVLITTLSVGLIFLSLTVVTGFAGQLSLAQYALAGVGAFVAARLASGEDLVGVTVTTSHVPFILALLIGGLAVIPIGLAVAIPATRIRGASLAIATLGLAVVIERVLLSNPDYTGGFAGTVVDPPSVLGVDLNPVLFPQRYALVCLVVFVLCAIAVSNIRRGRSGRRLLAVRSNERAAASLGISVVAAKLYAFGTAAMIAGLRGRSFSF